MEVMEMDWNFKKVSLETASSERCQKYVQMLYVRAEPLNYIFIQFWPKKRQI